MCCSTACQKKRASWKQYVRYREKTGQPIAEDYKKEKVCAICGKPVEGQGRSRYCSSLCAAKGKYILTENSRKRKPKKYKNQTLCWTCQNACCGCSWSQSFTPVEGWEAKPTKIRLVPLAKGGLEYIESYKVISCPNYIPDEERDC